MDADELREWARCAKCRKVNHPHITWAGDDNKQYCPSHIFRDGKWTTARKIIKESRTKSTPKVA